MSIASRQLISILESTAELFPWDVQGDRELRLALDFLGRPVAPDVVIQAGYVAGVAVGVSISVLSLVVPREFLLVVLLAGATAGLLTSHIVHTAPKLLATAQRTTALGAAPDLVARTVLSMRLSPTPERAAVFAATTGDGVLAESLARHVRQSHHTALSGLVAFGDSWADLFPSLRRSVSLVSAAGNANERDREKLLDRALAVVMDGTRDQMQSFGARVRTPATALYAFGVLLPTALVALLPAAGTVGIAVRPLTVIVIYNLTLPAILVGAAAVLLSRRPVAFPPPEITTGHPDVPDRRTAAVGIGAGVGLAAAIVTGQFVPGWGPPIAAVGTGVGLALWLYYQPIVDRYGKIQRIENSLPDALTLIGRRVANGRAVETAIEQTADELDSEMGDLLQAGAQRQRQLQVGIEDAFLGRNGVVRRLPSPRVQSSVALLALAAEEGRPAGTALLSLGEHVEDLQTIEREARHSLAHVCQTLQTTGTIFAPLVAGATVSLAEGISGEAFLSDGAQSLLWLGGPVGVYTLVLAVLLTALGIGLTRGVDRALVGYRAGRALCCATAAYFGSYLLVGLLL